MLMNIIMAVTMYPILLVMYFLLRGAGDSDKTYCFGATLKRELKEDEEVKQIVATYRRQMKVSTLILAILPIPSFFVPYFSVSMTIWMLWVLIVCFYPTFFFAKANMKLQELKRDRGWNEEYEVRYADLKTVSVARKVSIKDFLATIILSVVPVGIAILLFQKQKTWVFVWIVAIFAMCTILFYVSALWTDRQKVQVISLDSDINTNYARAKKQVWKNLWVYSAWTNTIFTWLVLLLMWQRAWAMAGLIIGTIAYGVAIMAICFLQIKKLRGIDKAYADKRTVMDAAEDDKNWIWGFIYYNKKDKHYMVENRMGTGTTVNLGTKAGMITEVIGFLTLLIIPIMCIWMFLAEFTPMQVAVKDDVIVCEHLKVEYEIPLSEIDSYTILEELPKLTKISGSGMEHLYSGTFEIWHEGTYEVFLNPQNETFIRIVTDDEVYIISGVDDSVTKEILAKLENIEK